jgi:transcriptional regulator with XRE-family HTH domain
MVVRQLRQTAGWTQARTSRASGVHRTKLSMAECGEISLSADEEAAVRRVLLRAIRNRAERINGVLTDAGVVPLGTGV